MSNKAFHRNAALANLFALLKIDTPTPGQIVIAERLVENISEYTTAKVRSKIGH